MVMVTNLLASNGWWWFIMVTPSYHPSVDGFFTINQPFWGTPMTYGHRDEAISPSAQVGGWVSNKKKTHGFAADVSHGIP